MHEYEHSRTMQNCLEIARDDSSFSRKLQNVLECSRDIAVGCCRIHPRFQYKARAYAVTYNQLISCLHVLSLPLPNSYRCTIPVLYNKRFGIQ